MSSPNPELPDWARVSPTETASWGPPDLGAGAEVGATDRADPIELAYGKGFEDGFNEGTQRAREGLGPARQALGNAIGALEGELALVRKAGEANLAALALVVARWLFQRAVETDPEVLGGLIRKAVALLPAGVPLEIVAHPDDLTRLSGELQFTEPDGRPLVVHWVGDGSLDRGSFRLVSPERLVDGRVDVALRSLYERLADQ